MNVVKMKLIKVKFFLHITKVMRTCDLWFLGLSRATRPSSAALALRVCLLSPAGEDAPQGQRAPLLTLVGGPRRGSSMEDSSRAGTGLCRWDGSVCPGPQRVCDVARWAAVLGRLPGSSPWGGKGPFAPPWGSRHLPALCLFVPGCSGIWSPVFCPILFSSVLSVAGFEGPLGNSEEGPRAPERGQRP